MARGYLGSGPKKQDNNGLVESEQRKFPVGGMHLHWCLELRQRRRRWGRPGSGELSYSQGTGRGNLTEYLLLAAIEGGQAGRVRSGLGGVGGT